MAGELIALETFADLDNWTITQDPTGIQATGGYCEVTVNATTDAPLGAQSFAEQTGVVWSNFTFYLESQSSANNNNIQGFGLRDGTTKCWLLGLANDTGTIRWQLVYNPDSGQTTVEAGTVATETEYDIEVQFQPSTGPGNDDGLIKVWVDDVLTFDITGIDNDGKAADEFIIGNNFRSSMNATYRIDNVLVGTEQYVEGGESNGLILLGVG